MVRTKLINLLRQLDKKEMVRLGHFLESPFFFRGRKEQRLIDLFHYLRPFHPKFSNKNLTKENAFAELFPGKAYNEQALQQLMTKFNRAIEHFIAQIYQTKSFGALPPSLGLAAFYREKSLWPYFKKLHQNETDRQARQSSKDPHHYWIDFLLAKDLTEQETLFNLRRSDLNIPQTLSRLDRFFLAAQLEAACVLVDQHIHHVPVLSENSLKTLEALEPLLNEGHYREEPLIDLLYRAYRLMREESTLQDFHSLQEAFEQHAMQIGFNQRQVVYGVLKNFGIKKLNEGEEEYLEPVFKLYQKGLSQGVMTFSGGLLPSTYQSVVALGLKLKKFDWVENFLEEYRDQLVHIEDPESIYTVNLASLLFAKGDYDKALDCLTYDFKDIYLKLMARRLEVQIYYELQSDLLEARIRAFKIFIYRVSKSRLTDLQREGYNNFIDLLKQVAHSSTRFNPTRRAGLIEKIKSKKTVAERQWLLDKVGQMH